MNKFLSKIKTVLFSEKEIICISNSTIKSRKFGFFPIAFCFCLVMWTCFATVSFFDTRKILFDKNLEISELKSTKQNLLLSIKLLEKDVKSVKNFIFSLNKYDRFATISDSIDSVIDPEHFNGNIEIVLNRAKSDMKDVNYMLAERIKGIQEIQNKLNVRNGVQLVSFEQKNDPNIEQFESDEKLDKNVKDSLVLRRTIDNNIESLKELELFVNSMPFADPINYDYISSHYGKRLDPFLKTPREHHGVDLVGSYMANIYAPADGKVTFVGKKSGYGNIIMIDHDSNVKTVYGHLSKFHVKVGDNVKRGDIIASQGSTGKSTGQHLHYEIVMDGKRYNPMNFIKIGKEFYFDSTF